MIDLDELQAAAEEAGEQWKKVEAVYVSAFPQGEEDARRYEVNEALFDIELAGHDAALLKLQAPLNAALARIARVEALHNKGTIYAVDSDYELDESRPILDYCAECTEYSTLLAIEHCQWDPDCPVVAWPCTTVRALTEGEPIE